MTDVPQRALVVEDDALFLALVGEVVTALGFEVMTLDEGGAALQAIFKAPPDLMIVDMGLPGVGGATLIRSLRATRRDAKIIAISGMGDSARHMALSAGVDAFLVKPFSTAALEQAVTDVVQH
jgi:two-component system KDP operon response regulator KdpE